MKYTRYEYKKYEKMKFIMTAILVIVVSIGSGLYISKFIFDSKDTSNTVTNASEKENAVIQSHGIMVLQCGYYSKKENADVFIPTISSYCQPFIVEEDGKYRVIAGIYDSELGKKKIEELKEKGIDVAKVSIEMPNDTLENKKILQIVEGFLQITGKFEESDVKSVKTEDFKSWANNIINDSNNVQSEKLNNIQSYVNNLPDEITKSNSSTSTEILYSLIKS